MKYKFVYMSIYYFKSILKKTLSIGMAHTQCRVRLIVSSGNIYLPMAYVNQ